MITKKMFFYLPRDVSQGQCTWLLWGQNHKTFFLARKTIKYYKLREEMRYTEQQEGKLPSQECNHWNMTRSLTLQTLMIWGPEVQLIRQLSERAPWRVVPWDCLGKHLQFLAARSWIAWLLCCINTTGLEAFSQKQVSQTRALVALWVSPKKAETGYNH